jgi:hypothetical protein
MIFKGIICYDEKIVIYLQWFYLVFTNFINASPILMQPSTAGVICLILLKPIEYNPNTVGVDNALSRKPDFTILLSNSYNKSCNRYYRFIIAIFGLFASSNRSGWIPYFSDSMQCYIFESVKKKAAHNQQSKELIIIIEKRCLAVCSLLQKKHDDV